MRGDGPQRRESNQGQDAVAPRARGWTPGVYDNISNADGCPACAGMDPQQRGLGARAGGLPRVRGDGPWRSPPMIDTSQVAPRARGWTRGARPQLVVHLGCPACAGMDPFLCATVARSVWLPRVRGDGPSPRTKRRFIRSVAPRARGWTPDDTVLTRVQSGCPACAGMDPRWAPRSSSRTGLPRVRGDGPRQIAEDNRRRRVAPRARGWTPENPHEPDHTTGCPACAGMDPPARSASAS